MKDSVQFWDNVHLNNITDSLGEGDFQVMTRGFQDDFHSDFFNAESYLDIGPGFGDALKRSPAQKKAAMDISVVSLQKIKTEVPGIITYLPTDDLQENRYSLITCISVIQHCDFEALSRILAFAKAALDSEGRFYLEGIEWMRKDDGDRYSYSDMYAGTYSWNADRILSEWGGACQHTNFEDLDENRKVWWACFTK